MSIKMFVLECPEGVSLLLSSTVRLGLNLIPRECLLRTPNQFVSESLDVDSCRVMNAQFDLYTIMREVHCEVIVIPGSDAVSVTTTWNSELSLSICWTLQIPLVILQFFPKHRLQLQLCNSMQEFSVHCAKAFRLKVRFIQVSTSFLWSRKEQLLSAYCILSGHLHKKIGIKNS